jgi:hypothetical protein
MGKDLPERHLFSLLDFLQCIQDRVCSKGGLYFSPLHRRESKAHLVAGFHALKRALRVPAYVYIAQRL